MTTDTAVRVTRMVILQGTKLSAILYVDFPEIKLDEHESTEMPFRYVVNDQGEPVMPEGMFDLIKADAGWQGRCRLEWEVRPCLFHDHRLCEH